MNVHKLKTLDEIREFLAGMKSLDVVVTTQVDRYRLVRQILRHFGYSRWSRSERGLLLQYCRKLTGYSKSQMTRLIRGYLREGKLAIRAHAPRAGFKTKYTERDITLLAQIDTLHSTLSGPATKKILARAVEHFGEHQYANLAGISVAHLYNLRKEMGYKKHRVQFTKTRPTQVPIGIRR